MSTAPAPPHPYKNGPSGAPSNLAAALRASDLARSTTEPYVAYGGTEDLMKACAAQCNYTIPNAIATPPTAAPKNAGGEDVGVGADGSFWYSDKGLALTPTFNTWAQIVMLHMYLLTVRLRAFPAAHAGVWHQNLLDHFFYLAEDRMAVWHGMVARGTRNKYLKDLWQQWRGVLLSYDEGLIKGDAVLAGAVWRNVFKADEGVDVADVALVVSYMRKTLRALESVDDGDVAAGKVTFGHPGLERSIVEAQSAWMRKPFQSEDLKVLEQKA